MTQASLTSLFGWMTVINVGLLLVSALLLTVFRNRVISLHRHVTGLDSQTLIPAYFYFLASYKMLIIVFNLVPYIAFKLI